MAEWKPIEKARGLDFTAVFETINRYPSQLIPVSVAQMEEFFNKGQAYYERDLRIALIARKLTVRSYLKIPIPPDTWHINMIASARHVKGGADEFMVRWLWQTMGRNVLSVYPYNLRAIKYYKRHGFKKVGQYNWPTFTVDIYQKEGLV